ncbi:hypothetical protein GGI43DRAFT_401817 [Trichoderma evansii]
MTNGLLVVLPASSYRTGCKAASGWIPNPLSIHRITKLHPIHDSFPRRQFRYRLAILQSSTTGISRKHPEAVHVDPAAQPEPARSSTLNPIPTSATVVSRQGHCRGTYKIQSIKNRVCATLSL